MIKRKHSWETGEFHDFLQARAAEPFVWGANDCCLFPADAILAFTGYDLAEPFRGRYTDEESAFALIRELTGNDTDPASAVADAAEFCAARAGLREWAKDDGTPLPLFARRGDLVVIEDAGRLIAGVMGLNGRHALTVGQDGLRRLPHSAVRRAWSV